MSTAGKTMLLVGVLLLLSGAQSQSFAREKLIAVSLKAPKSSFCTPLQALLVTKSETCELKQLPQHDLAKKAEKKKVLDSQNVISYATEPIYYVPVTPIPTVQAIPSPTAPSTTAQVPMDFVPANSASLNSDLILELINAHRASIGKAPFQKEGALCSLAQMRSIELQGELFEGKGYLHSGLYNRNLPYWITENAKWGSNEAGTVRWWLNSPIHRQAIDGDYTYSCGACNGSKCAQLFTSYTPKGNSVPLAPSH